METMIQMTKAEINANPFWEGFYPFIVKKATGRDYHELESFDCTKIDISPDIMNKWYSMAKHAGLSAHELDAELSVAGPTPLLEGHGCVSFRSGALTFSDGSVFPG